MKDFISALTRKDVQTFIADHEQSDLQKLLLKQKEVLGVPTSWVVQQIQGRRKAKEKLPLWYKTEGILYPPAVSLEQCSSEIAAHYKQQLVSGHHAADITGGFGVDTFYLSHVFDLVDYVEPDENLLTIAQHNHWLLGVNNIRYNHMTAEMFLRSKDEAFDLIFVDPSRRSGGRKVVRLQDCEPNVVELKSILLKKSRQVLIKSSPMLDLVHAQKEIKTVDQFIVLSVENECRELLITLKRSSPDEPTIHSVDVDREGESSPFAFTWALEKKASVKYSVPLDYIYEPNAAILKAGAFKLTAERFHFYKLAPDTHLYTFQEKVSEFPGRIFKVIEVVKPDKNLKEKFKSKYANIITRNYPLSVVEIKKKTGLEEGGTHYLICTRAEKPIVLIAERLK